MPRPPPAPPPTSGPASESRPSTTAACGLQRAHAWGPGVNVVQRRDVRVNVREPWWQRAVVAESRGGRDTPPLVACRCRTLSAIARSLHLSGAGRQQCRSSGFTVLQRPLQASTPHLVPSNAPSPWRPCMYMPGAGMPRTTLRPPHQMPVCSRRADTAVVRRGAGPVALGRMQADRVLLSSVRLVPRATWHG